MYVRLYVIYFAKKCLTSELWFKTFNVLLIFVSYTNLRLCDNSVLFKLSIIYL